MYTALTNFAADPLFRNYSYFFNNHIHAILKVLPEKFTAWMKLQTFF
jgi:hypothetical protein